MPVEYDQFYINPWNGQQLKIRHILEINWFSNRGIVCNDCLRPNGAWGFDQSVDIEHWDIKDVLRDAARTKCRGAFLRG